MALILNNFISCKLAAAPSPAISGLSFTVESGKGALFKSMTGSDWTYVVIKKADLTREVLKIVSISGDVFTAEARGADGTAAYAWSTGADVVVESCLCNAALFDLLYDFKLYFWNAAKSFKSIFTNTNTAARTYTFQDRNGTIADLGANTFTGAQTLPGAPTLDLHAATKKYVDDGLAPKAPSADPTFSGVITLGATWSVTESAGVLYFRSGGVNKAKIDASGNLTVAGNITAYGTV